MWRSMDQWTALIQRRRATFYGVVSLHFPSRRINLFSQCSCDVTNQRQNTKQATSSSANSEQIIGIIIFIVNLHDQFRRNNNSK